jgi:hypothetical protein
MIDDITSERWREEDRVRHARLPRCPDCGTAVDPGASVLDSHELVTCTKCYTVFPIEESD